MNHWQDSPTPTSQVPNYQILRTPPTKAVRAISLSDHHVGAMLHFYRGRTTPCDGAACQPCQEGHIPRWKGYLLAKSTESPKVVIFEFTQRAYQCTIDKFNKHGSLRGCIFVTQRLNRKPNGPLLVEWEEARADEAQLPQPADLRAMLERMWEVKEKGLKVVEDDHYEATDPARLDVI